MVIAFGIALVLGEVAMRIYHGALLSTRALRVHRSLGEEARAAYDAHLGWTSRPGTHDWIEGWVATVDETGVRQNGTGETVSGPPILAVGDSFTFGDEVHDRETWPSQLEARIERPVINAGVSGYGIDQAVLSAEALIAKYHPTLVILPYIADDITRCELSEFFAAKPYFDIVGGDLELRNQPVPPKQVGVWTILERSYLALTLIRGFNRDWWMAKTKKHSSGVDVARRLVTRLAERALRQDAELVLVTFPSRHGDPAPVAQVAAHARENGIRVLDLATSLGPKFAQKHGERPNWYQPQGHFCKEANAIVAAAIAEFVK